MKNDVKKKLLRMNLRWERDKRAYEILQQVTDNPAYRSANDFILNSIIGFADRKEELAERNRKEEKIIPAMEEPNLCEEPELW